MKNSIQTAEILCVGTELLLGDIVNTNAAFLSKQLADLGIGVYHHSVVGDNPERLSRSLELAMSRADMVITSGGLGPTNDDLTKETVADLLGLPLELHQASLESIRTYFKNTGREMTSNNEKQALIPRGAVVFQNRYGTAPAIAIEDEERKKTVVMLPGPPTELIPMFLEQILPYLKKRSSSTIVSKNIHFFGIGESALAQRLDALLDNSENPSVAPYCDAGEVRLRVTAKAETEADAIAMCDAHVKQILDSDVGAFAYGIDVGNMERVLVDRLHEFHLTLSVAESCTGGLISKRITDIPGCSDVFYGGCVTYTNDVKTKLLGVKSETLDKYTAVSAQVALEMARGVRERVGTDIGISATGIAGPGGGTADAPVGTVYIGMSTADGEEFRHLSLSQNRSREFVRTVSATNSYDMVLKYILQKYK